MNKFIAVIWAITTIILVSGVSVRAESRMSSQDSFDQPWQDTFDQILLAHHVGNRPDDAPDIEDTVHGGDYDPTLDPNGDAPPEPGRPENDPETENS